MYPKQTIQHRNIEIEYRWSLLDISKFPRFSLSLKNSIDSPRVDPSLLRRQLDEQRWTILRSRKKVSRGDGPSSAGLDFSHRRPHESWDL